MIEQSAGGVVYRSSEQGMLILMIQDRYGKITLPKGKMEAGETEPETALREIREETGIVARVIEHLETIRYEFMLPGTGRVDKRVHYFLAEATGGDIHVQVEEIRGAEWLKPPDVWQKHKQNGYGNNDGVLKKALAKLGFGGLDGGGSPAQGAH